MTMLPMLPGEEVVLSYLMGLAPVGQPVGVRHKWIEADFGYDHALFRQRVRALQRKGYVEPVTPGTGATPATMRVIRRAV